MILLDTHVVLWMTETSPVLSKKVRSLIDDAGMRSELLISAISFWEVAILIRKGRLRPHLDPTDWRMRVLDLGVREVPVDGEIAVVAGEGLSDLHSDPADRIIAASAMLHRATLVTADKAILRWARTATPRIETLNARRGARQAFS